jgi:hypothetical protein
MKVKSLQILERAGKVSLIKHYHIPKSLVADVRVKYRDVFNCLGIIPATNCGVRETNV